MLKENLNGGSARGVMYARADASAGGDPKKVLAELQTAWKEFQDKNDERLAAIEKGKADVVLNEQVDRINAVITELNDKLEQIALENAARSVGPNAPDAKRAEQIRAFGHTVGEPNIDAEAFQAYASGLNTYLRRGAATPRDVMAALSVGSDPDGGYTVTPDMSGRIVERVRETTPMRSLAFVTTIGTDALEGFNDLDEADSGWVGEAQTRTETGTPDLGKWSIPVHEIYAEPKATQKLLDDSMWDIEGWLSQKVADRFARQENAAFATGNGILKPKGLFTYPTAATVDASRAWGTFQHVNTGQSGGFATSDPGDELIDLVFAVKAAHRNNANWLMSRATVAAVRKLKDGDDNYLWQPNFEARQGGLLVGYPVAEGEDSPTIAANSLSMAFGDFREAYTIVDRVGIRMLRDPYTQKGFVKFYSTKRVGGGAVNFEAVKFLRFGS